MKPIKGICMNCGREIKSGHFCDQFCQANYCRALPHFRKAGKASKQLDNRLSELDAYNAEHGTHYSYGIYYGIIKPNAERQCHEQQP